jgi:hypothetical protein
MRRALKFRNVRLGQDLGQIRGLHLDHLHDLTLRHPARRHEWRY